MRLKRNTPYPLAVPYHGRYPNIQAVWTGEKRCPKKDEWYLSGAVIEAYQTPNDLSSEYHIARLVIVETKTVTRIIGEYEPKRTTGITPKRYRCTHCSHEITQSTNHYGNTYSCGRVNRCPNCGWKRPLEITVWECVETADGGNS